MKLNLHGPNGEQAIEIAGHAPVYRFRWSGAAERTANVEMPEPNVYSVLLDGRVYDARVEETAAGTLVIVIDGYRFEIGVRDPRRWSRKDAARSADGVQTVAAPMPGKVVRVLAAAGDRVEAGQGLLVVEAMKMQNEMKASRAGRILSVAVKEGATVVAGEVLATIE
ncbi:MAG TPA: biotin/lipoyl-containing protein [Bryobacteraceae bacterium]|nr:biotin/lipoyl-containing protein [Bryobacteraceae bacterium]